MNDETLFLLCLVASVAALVWALWWLFSARSPIDQRLNPGAEVGWGSAGSGPDLSNLLQRVGQTVGRPLEPRTEEDKFDLRRRLNFAGIYSRAAMSAFVGARMLLLLSGIVGMALLGLALFRDKNPLVILLMSVVGGLVGYIGPTFWLDWRIRASQLRMEHALPDALDLLVVCVESGLTMDAAFQRVGREVALAHPTMARELATAHLETQMGVPRMEALKNIYRRTGSTAVQSLTAMLIQADRFGTSIAQALRIYSESLRVKRRYKAEERAATAAVKISFPLVMFVFPALLIVIGGPALLRIKELPLF
jgi:tight adherence protein C